MMTEEAGAVDNGEPAQFDRDALVYVTGPAGGGRECAKCGEPVAGGAPAVSIAGLRARGLVHPECLPGN